MSRDALLAPGNVRRFFETRFNAATVIIAVVIVTIAYLVAVPLTFLIINTLWGPKGITFAGFFAAYVDDRFVGGMLINSLVYALGATVLAILLGTFTAFIVVRTDAPLKSLIYSISVVPLILPSVLYAFAWLLLADPNIGLINAFLSLFGVRAFNVLSLPGMILVEGLHLSPIAFLLMAAAFRSTDPSLDESAMMSGASRYHVIRRISIPLLRPAMGSAVLLIFVMGLESFETPSVLGLQSGIYVFTSRIYDALNKYPVDYQLAGAYAVGLLMIAATGVALSSRLLRNVRRYQTVTGKAFRPRPVDLGRWRLPLAALVALYFFLAVLAPVGVLFYASLLPFYRSPTLATFASLSFVNYATIFKTPMAWDALRNSFILGVGSATIVMSLMLVASWITARTRAPGRAALDFLAFSPLVVPGIVLGVSLAYVYLRMPLPIYGTVWILLIAYTTKYLPYGMRYATAAVAQAAYELEESAIVSGASRLRTLRRILLPLASDGIIAGWIYILIVSFRELSTAILLYTPGNEVLSILIWDQFNLGRFTVVAAIGVLMIVFLSSLVLIARRFGGAFGVESR